VIKIKEYTHKKIRSSGNEKRGGVGSVKIKYKKPFRGGKRSICSEVQMRKVANRRGETKSVCPKAGGELLFFGGGDGTALLEFLGWAKRKSGMS